MKRIYQPEWIFIGLMQWVIISVVIGGAFFIFYCTLNVSHKIDQEATDLLAWWTMGGSILVSFPIALKLWRYSGGTYD